MNLPRRLSATPLAFALAAVGLAAPAQAINLAPNGKGEVLIFPYYTVRNGFDTIVSLTNASDRTVLAALRLREATNGRTVGELHLILSPHDMWTAGVTSDGTNGAYLRSFDTSCTAPVMPAGPGGSKQIALSSANYDGSDPAWPYDNGGTQLSRVQEGFIEVIEMGISTIPESAIPTAGTSIETVSQHAAGVPRGCATVQNLFADPANFASSGSGTALPSSGFSSFEAPKNVLFGSATLINVGSGHAYDAAPTVIQNFRNTTPIVFMPQSDKPTLAHGDAGMTVTQFDRDGNVVTTPSIASPIDAVSVLLMADQVINEFASGQTDTSSARTDWVVTLPTKHFHTDEAEAGASAPLPPFSQAFGANGQSCDKYLLKYTGRDVPYAVDDPEHPSGGSFGGMLPPPPPTPFNDLCASVNVRTFQAEFRPPTGILDSAIAHSLFFVSSGWAEISFPLVNTQVYGTPTEVLRSRLLGFSGLPAIGFALLERNNSAEAGNNRNYGAGRQHITKTIAP